MKSRNGRSRWMLSLSAVLFLAACSRQELLCSGFSNAALAGKTKKGEGIMHEGQGKRELKQITLGAGCFWCVEAVFQQLKGVEKVVSGYSGGSVENPTYKQVCTGTTGHAEVAQITYDPSVVSFDEILEVFWKTHDPTTKNRQGHDVGTQYRSVIFYHDQEQKELAEKYKQALTKEGIWPRPIVTEIVPFKKFWPAEDYHQNYYKNNPETQYCSFVITPKIEKFRKIFKDKLKK